MSAGSFLHTQIGITHYEYSKGTSGKTVIMIHGFIIPSSIWEKNYYFLKNKGFGVLRYDHYGRGYSSIPRQIYSMDFYLCQLKELIDALPLQYPLYLIGTSMGGAIAFQFYKKYYELAGGLCLISPIAGNFLPPTAKLLLVPGLGEIVTRGFAHTIIVKNIKSMLHESAAGDDILLQISKQIQRPGFSAAFLSTIRNLLYAPGSWNYDLPGKATRNISLVWGKGDKVVPFAHASLLLKSLADCTFYPLEDTGHGVLFEKPHEINRILLEFLE